MMKKRIEKAGSVLLMALCMGIYCGYASGQSNGNMGEEQEVAEVFLSGEELAEGQQETEEETQVVLPEEEQETEEITPEEETEAEAFPKVILTEEEQKIAESTWANSHRSRIAYMDGYYYYSSQLDHYYLYRVKEDGSEPQCLAKIHPGSICAQDGYVFFINQSDGYGIYRIKADGTDMEKLCEDGHDLQISNEYVFFCSSYEKETVEIMGIEVKRTSDGLYRMKKDGSERKMIAEDVRQFVVSDGFSQETGDTYVIYYSRLEGEGMVAYKIDFDGQKEEELCHFVARGTLMVCGGNLYSAGEYNSSGITRFCLKNGEETSFSIPKYTESCIYKGYFYGLYEREEEGQRNLRIYRLKLTDLGSDKGEILYEDTIHSSGMMSGLYVTQTGVFLRRFVSEQEGCLWFKLAEDGNVQEFEDRETIPVTLPADYVYYADLLSVTLMLKDMSTEGYEKYLADGLRYEEYFSVDKDGEPANRFLISLPQFNSSIAGYQKINAYFQDVYQKALEGRDAFSESLDQAEPYEVYRYTRFLTGYSYIYVGEKYITVGMDEGGYPEGGIHNDRLSRWITFDRTSGDIVSLENILGMPTQEAVARLTGAIYKYKEDNGWTTFLLREENLLTDKFDPENFLLFPDGIGIYYPRYAINAGAAGDSLFIVPWEDLR